MALVAYDESEDSDEPTNISKPPTKPNLLSIPTCESSDEDDNAHFKRILNKSENKHNLKCEESKNGLTSLLPKPKIKSGGSSCLLIPKSVKRRANEDASSKDSVPFFSFVDKPTNESESKSPEKEIEAPQIPEKSKFGYGMYQFAQPIEPQELDPAPDQIETRTNQSDSQVEFLTAGGKRKRIVSAENILEINQTDLLGDVDLTQTKRLTEEAEYPIKVSKSMQPSGQQRRKHQLTYLAFQARQNDLELRNQWAANRATQRETRKKYGF